MSAEKEKANASKPNPKKVAFQFDKTQYLRSEFFKLACGHRAVHILETDDEHLFHGPLGVARLVVFRRQIQIWRIILEVRCTDCGWPVI